MTITPERVADLQPGDVVEMRWESHPGVTVSGPLRPRGGGQWVGPVPVIGPNGEMHDGIDLTVVSRAPRPLYVNHPRTEPVPGDVVRDADSDNKYRVWVRDTRPPRWTWADHPAEDAGDLATVRLRLLVDGETGQAVQ